MSDRWVDAYFVLHWTPGGALHDGEYRVDSYATLDESLGDVRTEYDFLVKRVPVDLVNEPATYARKRAVLATAATQSAHEEEK